jgi:hypothetical protein
MATALVEVPTGTLTFNTQEPGIWAGYVPNTVLSVRPDPRALDSSDTAIEITFSGIDPEKVYPLLDGVEMTVLSRTPTSMFVDTTPFITLGGPFRGTFGQTADPVDPDWALVEFLYDFTDDQVAQFSDQKGNHDFNSSGNIQIVDASPLYPGAKALRRSAGYPYVCQTASPSSLLSWWNHDGTFEAWVYMDSTVTGANNQQPICGSNSASWLWELRWTGTDFDQWLYWYNGASYSTTPGVNLRHLEDQTWYHVFLSFDASANLMKFGNCKLGESVGQTYTVSHTLNTVGWSTGEWFVYGVGQSNFRDWSLKGNLAAVRYTKNLKYGMDSVNTANNYTRPDTKFWRG